MRKTIFFVLAALSLVGCQHRGSSLQKVHLQGKAQGSYYSIIYYDSLARDFQPQIDSLLTAFDNSVSLWVDSSMLRRLNANQIVGVDETIRTLFDFASMLCQFSDSAFDCRIGKLVRAWGFGFDKREDMTDRKIDSLLQYCRQPITLDSMGNLHKHPETEIDFNAIAQGLCSDRVGAFLQAQGIDRYLVDIGGEIITKGTKPDGNAWSVGVERPAKDSLSVQEAEIFIHLTDLSIVTSGNYRKYYEKDGVRYSHTINPRTGKPVEHSLLSASVIAPTALQADGMATAFMVMGLEKSVAFIESHPDTFIKGAFFIYDDKGVMKTYATPEFKKLIEK